MNKVIFLGRLTKDPELKYSQSADPTAVCRVGIAVRRDYRKQNEPEADFFNLLAFAKTAEFISKHFKKGQMICVSGKLQNRSWEDQGGQKHTMTELVVQEVDFAGDKAAPGAAESVNASGIPGGFIPNMQDDDDLPF